MIYSHRHLYSWTLSAGFQDKLIYLITLIIIKLFPNLASTDDDCLRSIIMPMGGGITIKSFLDHQ